MCDVDEEAVVTAVDAPSIYDIPKVLHARGPRRLRRAPPRPAVPRRRLDASGTSCCAGCTSPTHEVTIALVGKYIDLPDAYLSVTEALRAGGFANDDPGQHPLGPVRRLRDAGGRRPAARRRRRHAASPAASACAASRARSARSGSPARTASRCSACASACSAWSSSTRATLAGLEGANSTEFDPDTAAPGHRDHGGPGRHRRRRARHGRHDAPRPVPGQARRRVARAPSCTARAEVDERHRHRYEVNNAYRDAARRGRAGLLGHVARRPPRRVRRAAARRAPVLRRHPGAPRAPLPADPRRIRCSAGLVGAALERQQASELGRRSRQG